MKPKLNWSARRSPVFRRSLIPILTLSMEVCAQPNVSSRGVPSESRDLWPGGPLAVRDSTLWQTRTVVEPSKGCYETLINRSSNPVQERFDIRESRSYASSPLDGARPLWARMYSSGLLPSLSNATAVAVDPMGDIYVTGSSDSTFSEIDYVTVKYSPAGVVDWIARYNGPGNLTDVPTAMGIDSSGSVCVTGASWGDSSYYDYCTIKYNSAGVIQWINRYNGPANQFDIPSAIAIDVRGNVYVTGATGGNGTFMDMTTIKYGADGTEKWVARYDGPGHLDDFGKALTVDDSGNVYVTGDVSTNPVNNTFSAYATVKYDSSGRELWSALHSHSATPTDIPFAIGLDQAHNVYVTGYSTDSVTGRDYTTIKYNLSGTELWATAYDGPAHGSDCAYALAVDDSADIIVTGWSQGVSSKYDFATIKYSSDGEEKWVSRYNGPGNSNDYAYSICIDDSGSTYVAGKSDSGWTPLTRYALVHYDRAGAEIWGREYTDSVNSFYPARTSVISAQGNIAMTGQKIGTVRGDYATFVINQSGDVIHSLIYHGAGTSLDIGAVLSIDAEDNLYVASENVTRIGSDITTLKYDSDGNLLWNAHFTDSSNYEGRPNTIKVDSWGNAYVFCVRSSYTSDSTRNHLLCYSSDGHLAWMVQPPGVDGGLRLGHLLALDDSGNSFFAAFEVPGFAVYKYSPAGIQQWVTRYDSGSSVPTAVVVDSLGQLYVCGMKNRHFFTIKYSPSGAQDWVTEFVDSTTTQCVPHALVVDKLGGVTVTGGTGGGLGGDCLTVRYRSDGVLQWSARYDGPGHGLDLARDIGADDGGNVYIVGQSDGGASLADFLTVKYSPGGQELWSAHYNGPGDYLDEALSVVTDGPGNVYVGGRTGYLSGFSTTHDISLVKYSPTGNQLWAEQYTCQENSTSEDFGQIALDHRGNVCFVGSCIAEDWTAVVTGKFEQLFTSVDQRTPRTPAQFALQQNYPNPFNPATMVRFAIPHTSVVTLKVYDVLGREVATLLNERISAGEYTVQWDADSHSSGVYFCRLRAGSFVATKKMLLLR